MALVQLCITFALTVALSLPAETRKAIPDFDEESNMVEPRINLWDVIAKPRMQKMPTLKHLVRLLTMYDARSRYVSPQVQQQQPLEESPREFMLDGPQELPNGSDSLIVVVKKSDQPSAEHAHDSSESGYDSSGSSEESPESDNDSISLEDPGLAQQGQMGFLSVGQEDKRRHLHSARFGWAY